MGGGGGGVFILFKQDLPLLEEPFLLVRLTSFGPNDITQKANRYIFAHFIDHLGSASEPLHCLRESIYKIINKEGPSCRVVLAGDFNLPDICWEDGLDCIKTSPAYGNEINNLFIDILNDFRT